MCPSATAAERCLDLKGLAIDAFETTLLVAHGHSAPTEVEWQQLMAAWASHPEMTTQLVFTLGGGPNVVQRRQSLEVLNARPGGSPKTAVMTDSLVVRGMVTALSWFATNRVAAFGPGALDDAFNFLGIFEEVRRDQLAKRLAVLRRLVGG